MGSETLRNGYFTYYLIRALMQDHGLSPIGKIYAYVKDQVPPRVRR